MRIFVYAAMIALATSNAFALEDCNRDSEVNRRLECLQKNNEELANRVARLDDLLKHVLKDDASYSIQAVGGMCLAGDPSGNFLRSCADTPGAKFHIRP